MILLFPNTETIRLALTSSVVPTEVTLAPAAVTFDDQGKIYLETEAALSRAVTRNLDKIGVKGSKRHATNSPDPISCWPQVLPLVREAGTPNVSNQASVLFELTNGDDLPTLVSEMLRLGNDRQSFRWFEGPGDEDSRRVLLRVIGPPYYTLLRAIDASAAGTKGSVRAFLEAAPRVWVELGYTHPLASQIRVADGQFLLLNHPRGWTYLEDVPFQDVYDILQFKLPASPVGWTQSAPPEKISVPLRLTAGNAADVPELWVLREPSSNSTRSSGIRTTALLSGSSLPWPQTRRANGPLSCVQSRPNCRRPPWPLRTHSASSRSGSCPTCSSRWGAACTRPYGETRCEGCSPTTRTR
jgi:hypothetical protein